MYFTVDLKSGRVTAQIRGSYHLFRTRLFRASPPGFPTTGVVRVVGRWHWEWLYFLFFSNLKPLLQKYVEPCVFFKRTNYPIYVCRLPSSWPTLCCLLVVTSSLYWCCRGNFHECLEVPLETRSSWINQTAQCFLVNEAKRGLSRSLCSIQASLVMHGLLLNIAHLDHKVSCLLIAPFFRHVRRNILQEHVSFFKSETAWYPEVFFPI